LRSLSPLFATTKRAPGFKRTGVANVKRSVVPFDAEILRPARLRSNPETLTNSNHSPASSGAALGSAWNSEIRRSLSWACGVWLETSSQAILCEGPVAGVKR
jgi:hypothetical protein